MFAVVYILMLIYGVNLQLDKLFAFGKKFSFGTFDFILSILLLCSLLDRLLSSSTDADFAATLYLFFNIFIIATILCTYSFERYRFSAIVIWIVLILNLIAMSVEEFDIIGRKQGILGTNGAAVLIIFLFSIITGRVQIFLLAIVAILSGYYTGSRATVLVSVGIAWYLMFQISSKRTISVVMLLVLLLLLLLKHDYISMFMLRTANYSELIEIGFKLNYDQILSLYHDSPLISDLDRIASIKILVNRFDVDCLLGCKWEHVRPIHSSFLELIFNTGIFGILFSARILIKILLIPISSIYFLPSFLTFLAIAFTGPIQFSPMYYVAMRMLYVKYWRSQEHHLYHSIRQQR